MNRGRKIAVAITLAGVLLGTVAGAQEGSPRIVVDKDGLNRKILIALAPFHVTGVADAAKKRQEIEDIITFDLEFSGLFALHSNRQYIAEAEAKDRQSGKVDYDQWNRLGVEAVVKGDYEQRGSGYTLKYRVYHVKDGIYVGGEEITSRSDSAFRQGVHKVSDEIQYRLTGDKGIARTRIAFVMHNGRTKEIYVVDYDGFKGSVRPVTKDRGIALFPTWHPSGDGIAFTSYIKHNPDLYLLDFKKGKRIPLAMFPGLNYAPAFHPKGDRLLLTLSKDGNPEIYEMELDNPKNLRRLTNHPGIDCSPAYSPDGKKIVFTSARAGNPSIHIMNADGTGVRKVSRGRYDDQAVWSPRGDVIAYCSQNSNGNFDVCLSRPDGSEYTNITKGKGGNENPDFSPDGRHLVFSSNRSGKNHLYAFHLDPAGAAGDVIIGSGAGSTAGLRELERQEPIRLTWVPNNCTSPSWSPF